MGLGLLGFQGQDVLGAGAEVVAAGFGAMGAGEEAAVGAQVGAEVVHVQVAVVVPQDFDVGPVVAAFAAGNRALGQ